MTCDASLLTTGDFVTPLQVIYTPRGQHLHITQCGIITFAIDPSGCLALTSVFVETQVYLNLILSGVCVVGLTVSFSYIACVVHDPRMSHRVGHGHNPLNFLDLLHGAPSTNSVVPSICSSVSSNVEVLHRHLGHVSNKKLWNHIESTVFSRVSFSPVSCTSFKMGKSTALPFATIESIFNSLFDLSSI